MEVKILMTVLRNRMESIHKNIYRILKTNMAIVKKTIQIV